MIPALPSCDRIARRKRLLCIPRTLNRYVYELLYARQILLLLDLATRLAVTAIVLVAKLCTSFRNINAVFTAFIEAARTVCGAEFV